jgi:hypothetical protein
VPDYGYSSWLIHPVSPTIFLSLELSCTACYSITFQPFVRHSEEIVFLNEVPLKPPFVHRFLQTSEGVKNYFDPKIVSFPVRR